MKKGILPTAAALLVCAALLGVPALWARLSDARRLNTVQPRPALAGALDEEARAIPVLYELHAGASDASSTDREGLPEPDLADLCAEAAEPVAALADAGVISAGEKARLDALLAQAPLQYYRQNSGALQSLSLVWPRQDAAASTAAIHLSRQIATGVYVSFGLSVGGDLDAETRLRAWLVMLGVDVLGDWEPVDTGSYADTFALYSAKGQATAYCTAAAGWVNLQLSKGSHTF